MTKEEIIKQVISNIQLKILKHVHTQPEKQLREKMSDKFLYTLEDEIKFKVWRLVRRQVGDPIHNGLGNQL